MKIPFGGRAGLKCSPGPIAARIGGITIGKGRQGETFNQRDDFFPWVVGDAWPASLIKEYRGCLCIELSNIEFKLVFRLFPGLGFAQHFAYGVNGDNAMRDQSAPFLLEEEQALTFFWLCQIRLGRLSLPAEVLQWPATVCLQPSCSRWAVW